MLLSGSSSAGNSGQKSSITDLRRLQRDIHWATHYMIREVQYQDATIFIGSTRSGKSTLINYLIGNQLIGAKIPRLNKIYIKKVDNSPGPEIGVGPTSETIFPSKWNSQQPFGLTMWDAPGFEDNRGVVQDITNAFYIYELFKNIRSAKIVLVTDINDIVHDNIGPFLSLLNSVEKILKDKMGDCFPGIAIVFSKVPKEIYGRAVDKNLINELLDYQFLSSKDIDLSQPAKGLIKYLTENNQQIGVFKIATLGAVTGTINEGIFEAIQSATSISEAILKEVSPSIAEKSKLFLYEVREQLCSTEIFGELQTVLKDYFEAKGRDFAKFDGYRVPVGKLHQQCQELSISKDKLLRATDPTISFDKKIDAVRDIDDSIAQLVDEYNLLEGAKLMQFTDQLLHLKESKHFETKLQDLLLGALSIVQALIINIQLHLEQISKAQADAQILELTNEFKEKRKQLEIRSQECTRHDAKEKQKFNQHFERMFHAQAETFKQYFKDLKEEQERIHKKDEQERDMKRRERKMRQEQETKEADARRERDRKEAQKERKKTERRLERLEGNTGDYDVEIKVNLGKLLDKVFNPFGK